MYSLLIINFKLLYLNGLLFEFIIKNNKKLNFLKIENASSLLRKSARLMK